MSKYFLLIVLPLLFGCSTRKPSSDDSQKIPEHKGLADWKKTALLFDYSGEEDWKTHWFLDGTKAIVENGARGMLFQAGPDWKNDTSHAVLWTQKTFSGDLLIEFDYTKTDSESRGVNILYFHASGTGEPGYPKDLYEWREKREIPTMSTYFRNMNAYHISYAAAHRSDEDSLSDYVRLRRYEGAYRLKGTEILPDNYHTGLFKKDVTYHFEVVRHGNNIIMTVTNQSNPDESKTFRWDAAQKPLCESGRIGIRHMYTRGAIYKNFKVWTIDQ